MPQTNDDEAEAAVALTQMQHAESAAESAPPRAVNEHVAERSAAEVDALLDDTLLGPAQPPSAPVPSLSTRARGVVGYGLPAFLLFTGIAINLNVALEHAADLAEGTAATAGRRMLGALATQQPAVASLFEGDASAESVLAALTLTMLALAVCALGLWRRRSPLALIAVSSTVALTACATLALYYGEWRSLPQATDAPNPVFLLAGTPTALLFVALFAMRVAVPAEQDCRWSVEAVATATLALAVCVDGGMGGGFLTDRIAFDAAGKQALLTSVASPAAAFLITTATYPGMVRFGFDGWRSGLSIVRFGFDGWRSGLPSDGHLALSRIGAVCEVAMNAVRLLHVAIFTADGSIDMHAAVCSSAVLLTSFILSYGDRIGELVRKRSATVADALTTAQRAVYFTWQGLPVFILSSSVAVKVASILIVDA